ncbi:MAG: alpha,alpha-trehalase TreA [Steroidobacteraceae bacterium]|jgi:alpha,alpha-trehalase
MLKTRSPRLNRSFGAALVLAVLPLAALRCEPTLAPPAPYPQTPQVLFGELFAAVQTAPVFADGKAFADAVPTASPAEILDAYRQVHPVSPDDLRHFVDAHFVPAAAADSARSPPADVSIVAHIDRLWDQLTRRTTEAPRYASLLPLPAPYVVPGGRFREIYYWDSYFTMLGLDASNRRDLIADMVTDFASFIDTYGHIPNGARSYYLSRSQPPFFFEMVGLLTHEDPAASYARYLPELEREYAFWMDGERDLKPGSAYRRLVALPDGALLNRYWDDLDSPRDEAYRDDVTLARSSGRQPATLYRNIRAAAESGWDFSSRWFGDAHTRATMDTTEILPIDLNSLLYGLENAIRAGCERRSERGCVQEFTARAATRRAAINRYLWDESRGAYFDYRWSRAVRQTQLTAATMYPLFVQLASTRQAAAVAKRVRQHLLKRGGLVTTTLDTGQQWDAPNGWAPLQWIAIVGLRSYGNPAMAAAIACRWMRNVSLVYARTGKLVEKYDVINPGRGGGGGEYPTQDGFGWTNGVMRRLLALYPNVAADTGTTRCPPPQ